MALTAGSRLGPFEILGAIGAGGMGEVYRARDTSLGRDVAIKVLPELWAADPDRIARFEREAQLLAALNHPNIEHIHGVEGVGATKALVLELVDGQTLADLIRDRPRGIPMDEALPIARQIAAALEAAHESGIVHRDLKPANIKVTPDGTVKVLDFGLAKAAAGAAEASGPANRLRQRSGGQEAGHYVPGPYVPSPQLLSPSPPLLSQSPTITSPAMHTHAGIILGTAVYMSPEQAKGRPADKRSDVWAFGCVLFEMLTGARAFDGEDLTDVVAAVVRGEPDWSALPAAVPPHIRTLVKGCLEKDRKARIGDMAVVRFLLDQGSVLPGAVERQDRATPSPSRMLMLAAGALVALVVSAAAVALAVWHPWQAPPPPSRPVRLTANIGADVLLPDTSGSAAVISPDGATLAFVGVRDLGQDLGLYVRRLDQLQATFLTGTEGALNPFFSPDGEWIAFFAGGKLKKVAAAGGVAVTLCDAPQGRGGTWSIDGTIIFTPTSTPGSALHRVSAEGGTPQQLVETAPTDQNHRWPQALPRGNGVIFTAPETNGNYDNANIVLQPLPSGERKVLIKGGMYARYAPSGHLLYFRQRTLFAVPFDADRMEITGSPVPVLEGARASNTSGGAQFDVSANGTLVYVPGETLSDTTPVRWMERDGRVSLLRATPSNWSNPAFSPDGRLLAMDIHDGSQADVWVYDVERGTLSRRTFDTADDQRPVWSPDGEWIAFASRRAGAAYNLYIQRADGTGDATRLTTGTTSQWPTSFHPDGRVLAYLENTSVATADLMMLPLERDGTAWKAGTPSAFLKAPYSESSGMFSPDGRWLAYISNESGRNEIFVQPYPGPGGKYQISITPGDDPTWSRVSQEFFFLNLGDQRLMVVPYKIDGSTFSAGKPVPLNDTRIVGRPRAPSRDLDLHPDGRRFAMAGADSDTRERIDEVVLVFNFFDELKRVAPTRAKD